MKIYVAGKFEKKEQILEIYQKLRELGHTISYDWTTHKSIKPYQENQELAQQYSNNELVGITNCDLFIFLSDEKGTTLPMEFGAALILNKTKGKPIIYTVGEYNNKSPWFFQPAVKRRNSVEEVLNEIKNPTP